MKKGSFNFVNSLSQSEQLKKNILQVYVLIILVIVSLSIFLFVSTTKSSMLDEETETTIFLNQYRLGSKALTASVQSYAVTGDRSYYDDYMRELEVDMNREVAWSGLLDNDITQEEWAMMQSIADMSNNLVPLETEAMEAISQGDTKEAIEAVFGDEYQETIRAINTQTTELISAIQNRLERKANLTESIQYLTGAVFVLCLIIFLNIVLRTIKFSQKELLDPIVKIGAVLCKMGGVDWILT